MNFSRVRCFEGGEEGPSGLFVFGIAVSATRGSTGRNFGYTADATDRLCNRDDPPLPRAPGMILSKSLDSTDPLRFVGALGTNVTGPILAFAVVTSRRGRAT